MNLLILGGGVFLGQALLSAALAEGHSVTVFNRGLSRQWWPPGVKWIVGDRTEDLHLLMNGNWDAVIDTCGYRPQDVELSCAALFDSCDRYVLHLQRFGVCLVLPAADPRNRSPRLDCRPQH